MRVVLACLALTACASPQRLSESIYRHEQRGEWAAAQKDREALARHQHVIFARDGY